MCATSHSFKITSSGMLRTEGIHFLCLQLILRSINSSRSAYASITYTNAFFDAYNVFGSNVVQAGVLAKVSAQTLLGRVPAALPAVVMHNLSVDCLFHTASTGALQNTADFEDSLGAGQRRQQAHCRGISREW